jgi:hypothetical protein
MHVAKGHPPDPKYETYSGTHVTRRDVALGRPGFEPWGAEARLAEFKVIPRPLKKVP